MGNTISIDNQINMCLDILNERQKKALLTVAKTFADELKDGRDYNEDFIAELDRRTDSLERGIVTGSSWEDVKRKAKVSGKSDK